jgi:hypothetical protein
MFKLLSTAYSKKLQQSTVKHQGLVPVKKSDFFSLSWDAWVTSFTEKNILNSFKTTGVSPLNPNVIQYLIASPTTALTPQVRHHPKPCVTAEKTGGH